LKRCCLPGNVINVFFLPLLFFSLLVLYYNFIFTYYVAHDRSIAISVSVCLSVCLSCAQTLGEGKTSPTVLRCLWTKLHQIWGTCRGVPIDWRVSLRLLISCFFAHIFSVKFRSWSQKRVFCLQPVGVNARGTSDRCFISNSIYKWICFKFFDGEKDWLKIRTDLLSYLLCRCKNRFGVNAITIVGRLGLRARFRVRVYGSDCSNALNAIVDRKSICSSVALQ